MLNRQEIEGLIKKHGLVADYIDLETQLTSNGFDLTIGKIFTFSDAGVLDFSNKERKLPSYQEVIFEKTNPQDKFGWLNLKKGAYKIVANETVNLPADLTAIAFARSSLLRMGAFTQTAVWDAGFKGKSEFILVVDNPAGLKVKENARIVQLVFFRINATNKLYNGIYQENP